MIHLHIGEMAVAGADHVVSTVLGSCVSVSLYSPAHGIGGLIHYALPFLPPKVDESDPEALRYGDYAIHALVHQLREMTGEDPRTFHAKIVGGASGLSENSGQAGPGNIRVAEKTLGRLRIPIRGRDVGGGLGRKVLFHPGTGRLQVALL